MTAVALSHAPPAPAAPRAPAPRLRALRGGGASLAPTLDAVIGLAWTALSAGAPAACPVCDGSLEPLASGAGRCQGCGTTLE